MLIFPNKDPDEVLDYQIDWSARIVGDAITNSVWSLQEAAGLTIDSDSTAGTGTTVWLSGGTAGEVGVLLNTITTGGGRTLEETAAVSIVPSAGAEFPIVAGYDLPTPSYVRAAFTGFNDVPDSMISFWISRASRSVDESWTEGDYTFAIALLAAHLMTGNGLGAGAEIDGYRAAGITKLKSGTLDVTFADGSGGGSANGYETTAFGRQFLALLRQNKGGPRVVRGGSVCDGETWAALGIQNNGGIVPWAS